MRLFFPLRMFGAFALLLEFSFGPGCLSHRAIKPLPDPVNPSTAGAVPANAIPATPVPAAAIPATAVPANAIPTTPAPTTAIPATVVPASAIPSTAVLVNAIPTTPAPTTAIPATAVPVAHISTASVPMPTVPVAVKTASSLDPGIPPVRQEPPATVAPSETSRKVQIVLERIVNAIVDMNGAALFGLAAIVAMLVFYTLANRSPFFILAFALACWIGSAYGFVHWPWPFGMVGGIWGLVAMRKWWREIKSRNGGVGKAKGPVLVWPTRYVYFAAVICGVVLLIVDSPIPIHLPIPVSRAIVEAMPLLLVGIAFLAWLAIERPATVDLIKQAFIALAFILWGVDLLMPAGPWATFVGAVVIAIYVFDLAWLMEGNLRKKLGVPPVKGTIGCTSEDCRSAGICSCDGSTGSTRDNT